MISKDSFYSTHVDRGLEGIEFKRHSMLPGELGSEEELEFRKNFPDGYLKWVNSFFSFLHSNYCRKIVGGAQKYKYIDYTTVSIYFTALELRELKLDLI